MANSSRKVRKIGVKKTASPGELKFMGRFRSGLMRSGNKKAKGIKNAEQAVASGKKRRTNARANPSRPRRTNLGPRRRKRT